MKVVIGTQEGKSYQTEIDENKQKALIGLSIGEEFSGDSIGLSGYTLAVTGGSDKEGFPMRPGIPGTGRKRIMLDEGVGVRTKKRPGQRVRRGVRGNTISDAIEQLNLRVVKSGKETVSKLLGLEQEATEEGSEKAKEEKGE